MMPAIIVLVALGETILMGQDSQRPPQWRDRILQGTEAFRNGRLSEAISAFQSASDSNPTSPIPHLYLALAFLQQSYAANVGAGDNVDLELLAEAALRRALELDPANWTAIVLLGSSASNSGRVDEAREWYRKAVAMEPRNADAWATLGAIDFRRSVQNGWRENEIEESIRDFEKSIALNPAHETAMEYLSFLLRRRASIKPDGDAARKDLTAADNWEERASDARADKLQTQIAHPVRRAPDVDDPDALLKERATFAVLPPPPPAPPPPPPPMGFGPASSGAATIVFEPIAKGAGQAPPVRVAPVLQAQKLITKVEARLPPGAQPEKPLRFVVVIGSDGRIARETQVSGSPWMKETAVAALRRWVYQTTMIEGKPVDVVTEVRVEFTAAK